MSLLPTLESPESARQRKEQAERFGRIGAAILIGIAIVWLWNSSRPAPYVNLRVEEQKWVYVRPYFYVGFRVFNVSNRPAKTVRATAVFTDSLRIETVGMNIAEFTTKPLGPGESRIYSMVVHAPDLPLYLLRNLVPMSAVMGKVEVEGRGE